MHTCRQSSDGRAGSHNRAWSALSVNTVAAARSGCALGAGFTCERHDARVNAKIRSAHGRDTVTRSFGGYYLARIHSAASHAAAPESPDAAAIGGLTKFSRRQE